MRRTLLYWIIISIIGLILFTSIQSKGQSNSNQLVFDTLVVYKHYGVLMLVDTVNNDTVIHNLTTIYSTDSLTLDNPLIDMTGKMTAGSFGSPLDVGSARKYGYELHYSGDNNDATAIRARAQAVTTDAPTKTMQGAEIQAANTDGVNISVLNGIVAEAIGKGSSAADRIGTMRGGIFGVEWSALDTITDVRIGHFRAHTRDASGDGCFDGTGYGVLIENEAVGGNGQALDAAIAIHETNISGGNFAYTDGIDMSDGTYDKAEIVLRETVSGEKTIIASGSAANDADIVTDVGADNTIADGSLYLSIVDGAGKIFLKQNDVWVENTP